jgi:MFS family permease
VLPGFLVGALALQVRADLGVSVSQVGLGVTVFFAAGALGSGPGGRLAERIGGLMAMRLTVLTAAVAMAAIAALADSLAMLFVLLALGGLANGVAQPSINLFMAEAVPGDRQGLAFGVKQSAIPAAILVSGLALPALALPLGWRPTFAICAVGAAVVALAASRLEGPELPSTREAAPLVSRPLLLLTVGAAFASAGPSALGAYLVASAVDAGLPEGGAGLVVAAGSAASLVSRVLLGARADRRRDYGFGAVVALLAGGSLGFASIATGQEAALVAGALVAFAIGWGWPGLFNLAVVDAHRAAPGAATGVTQVGIYVGASGGPALFGLLSSELGYGAAWATSAALALAAAVAIALAARAS